MKLCYPLSFSRTIKLIVCGYERLSDCFPCSHIFRNYKKPSHLCSHNLQSVFNFFTCDFAICKDILVLSDLYGVQFNGCHMINTNIKIIIMRWLKDHILHLFPGTFVRGYGYDPMALSSKCSLLSPDYWSVERQWKLLSVALLIVEFHLEPAASSNPLVQCDFFCSVFHVCLVWVFFFFLLKVYLQYGVMM